MSAAAPILGVNAASIQFQNPVILAAGTAAYGRELEGVMHLDALGGLVTKAVSVEPRHGASPPRVAEFEGGMINAVGLANPGVAAVKAKELPWLSANLNGARVIVNIVGSTIEDYSAVVESLDDEKRVDAFELNVSCPNTKAGGTEFGADLATLATLVRRAREATARPLFVKLSPMLPSVADTARTAVDAGADGISLVNTIPGLVIDIERRRPAVGFGSGGISGVGLLAVGLLAVWKVRRAVSVPLIGVGGVTKGVDAIQYLMAGATLVAVGTAALRNPRAPERVVREIAEWCVSHDVRDVSEIIGSLEWPE